MTDKPGRVARLVTQNDQFSVLAHVDYPVRFWPQPEAGRFDPSAFEEEFRDALRAAAETGRALWRTAARPSGSASPLTASARRADGKRSA
jgi:histidinol phosphatase-like PHP family hydrolase